MNITKEFSTDEMIRDLDYMFLGMRLRGFKNNLNSDGREFLKLRDEIFHLESKIMYVQGKKNPIVGEPKNFVEKGIQIFGEIAMIIEGDDGKQDYDAQILTLEEKLHDLKEKRQILYNKLIIKYR